MHRTQFQTRRQSTHCHAMTLGKPVDSFCSAGKGGKPDGDRTRQRGSVAWRSARTIEKRSPGSALPRQLPESVSRHLVSTSVQFGQSAAGKTESDQWPFSRLSAAAVIHDVGSRGASVVLRHDQGQNAVARTNLEYIAEIGVHDANSAHCHLRNFS